MSNRDEFSEKTKRALAARAGWRCSFRGCPKLTVGPSEEAPDAVTVIGDAAHICGASSGRGSRRYVAEMTPQQRSDIENAIWLCADHARLIDRDEVTFTAEDLRLMKREHEATCARAVRTGSCADLPTGLLEIGPDIVCTGEIASLDARSWTLILKHFIIGDIHVLASFIDSFARQPRENTYVLINELGDGRLLSAPPKLTKHADSSISLLCPVAPATMRIDVDRIGSGYALDPTTNDLYLDNMGHIARVSGVEYFAQRVREVLSMQQGENWLNPTAGVRFSEYFEAYHGSPWLDMLLKLEIIRQASIPLRDALDGQSFTPLRSVERVHSVELLSLTPTKNWLPIRIDLEVHGIGRWTRDLSIYVSTVEQMAERKAALANSSR